MRASALNGFLGAEDGEHDVAMAEAVLSALAQDSHQAAQPPHWLAEVLAVIALKRPHKIEDAFKILQAVPHELNADAQIYRRAAALSHQLKHHLFDTLYHAVALELGATLITADDIYFAKAFRLGNIKLLTNFAEGQDAT